jgi:hypothetical protein
MTWFTKTWKQKGAMLLGEFLPFGDSLLCGVTISDRLRLVARW